MPFQTPNYNFALYDTSIDLGERFIDFRKALSGIDSSSNFQKLDGILYDMQEDITDILMRPPILYAQPIKDSSSTVDTTYYNIANDSTTILSSGMFMVVDIRETNVGDVRFRFLNPSPTAFLSVYKRVNDVVSTLSEGDFRSGSFYLLRFQGDSWRMVGVYNAEQVNISGTPDSLVVVGADKTLVSSATKQSELALKTDVDALASTVALKTNTVNGKQIGSNPTITKSDVGLSKVLNQTITVSVSGTNGSIVVS